MLLKWQNDKKKLDENLYEFEIVVVNKERKQIKIHFVDYCEQFDEWRDLMTLKGITFPSFVWKRYTAINIDSFDS